MQSETVAFLFILHIQVCLYVHNAIDISAYGYRTYGDIRPPYAPRRKSGDSKGLYQLYLI